MEMPHLERNQQKVRVWRGDAGCVARVSSFPLLPSEVPHGYRFKSKVSAACWKQCLSRSNLLGVAKRPEQREGRAEVELKA